MKIHPDRLDTERKNLAYQIVDFMYTIEFLYQESFPKSADIATNKTSENNSSHLPTLTLFYSLPLKKAISDIIQEDTLTYQKNPILSDKIHICFGKVAKEPLIINLYRELKLENNRPEKKDSEVCLIGLKVNKDGTYVASSLSISPLVWGIAKCVAAKGKIDGVITRENYNHDVRELEKMLDPEKPIESSVLTLLCDEIGKKYIQTTYEKPDNYKSPTMQGCLVYSRYDNEDTYQKEDEKAADISELVNGFFIQDLDMLRTYIKDFGLNDIHNKSLSDYIIGLYAISCAHKELLKNTERIDIRTSKQDITNWLSVSNAPLGKWPSRFNPVLMQQIAVNIETSKLRNQTIFSVNGPPGTGKTTLLKEIIASNIVKRACLLCNYEKADDAFVKKNFLDGDYKTKNSNGYDRYYHSYYAFKDDSMTDFSMLVASCNNAAVENITKELPDGLKLIKDLQPSGEDVSDTKNNLYEISDLFDVKKTERSEIYKICNEKTNTYESIEKQDIYFSWLAQNLINSDNQTDKTDKITTWGIISAPMGKLTNLRQYYHNVLSPLIDSFFPNNALIENRQERYTNARKQFRTQLELVENMQSELEEIGNIPKIYAQKKHSHLMEIRETERTIQNYQIQQQSHMSTINDLKVKQKDIESLFVANQLLKSRLEAEINSDSEHLESINHLIEQYQTKIIELEDSRKLHEVFLSKWISTERLRLISQLKEKLVQSQVEISSAEQTLADRQNEYSKVFQSSMEYTNQLLELDGKIEENNKAIELTIQQTNKETQRIEKLYNAIQQEQNDLESMLKQHGQHMTVMDESFWKKFDSEDNTEVQTSNPWITDEFNRAREKLFYLALQVHKEFILSSKSCRNNFCNLAMLWKFRRNSDKSFCNFSLRDREMAYPHLLNTLFLVTPVMSTTFASVGRFLKDIKEPGQLGLLIIDEAGQASPHMALGALWRCRRAIVVGDPKQVEPVVPDETDAIKKAFSNDILAPYLDKAISVQMCADQINKYGSNIKDTFSNHDTWVGCPLIVHRRCIEPMFTISNSISYGGTMKMQTAKAKQDVLNKLSGHPSCWLDVAGTECGNTDDKNHFVKEQGEKALELIRESFRKYNGLPDLYVISPFKTVIDGIKNLVNQDQDLQYYKNHVKQWTSDYCGTVHKFQGKEANEVIFLLGCDQNASGAVAWVNPNILNVAATRAKYRLYIIGDYQVWKNSEIFMEARKIIDKLA